MGWTPFARKSEYVYKAIIRRGGVDAKGLVADFAALKAGIWVEERGSGGGSLAGRGVVCEFLTGLALACGLEWRANVEPILIMKVRAVFMDYQTQRYVRVSVAAVVLLLVVWVASAAFQTVPAGHVGVATFFGKVQEKTYAEGMHFPVNPLYKWHLYDARMKSHKETAGVPSQDQLTTTLEVSVQYRVNRDMATIMLGETGEASDALNVHLVPRLRSLLREQGKSIRRAEDFFQEETQLMLQQALTSGLREFLAPKGLEVEDVLIRDIRLPAFITRAIEGKKEREQEVEKQKAELERFKLEQQQLIAEAQAKREAAEQQATMKRTLADAQAYEIEKLNEAIANNAAYIQLQALQTLQAMAKDPAAKIYFIDGESSMPLPLLHMGEAVGGKAASGTTGP